MVPVIICCLLAHHVAKKTLNTDVALFRGNAQPKETGWTGRSH